jgi:hypothetical protein
MFPNRIPAILTVALALGAFGHANAATIDDASFNPLTNGAVVTAGLADWGYVEVQGTQNNGLFDGSAGNYNDLAYGSLDKLDGAVLTTVSGSSTIGPVTVTEGQGLNGSTNFSAITFDGTQAYGGIRSLAPSEDAFTINFNDLGVGTFTITLYLGHSATNRTFTINETISDGGVNVLEPTATASGAISGLGSTVVFSTGVAFTYEITVTTTAATQDLALNLVSTGGSSGDGLFAGYTVESTAVPEPASLATGLLGLTLIALRRRSA